MISVRSAAIGRIEALDASGALTVAGQTVSVPLGTWNANRFGLGDWVAVSGLRRDDGTIVASRLDVAPQGVLLARGQLLRAGAAVRVGNLTLTAPMATSLRDGQFVAVSGSYAAGRIWVDAIVSDVLFPNPVDFFGPTTNRLIMQGFVRVEHGFVAINGVRVSAASAGSERSGRDGIAVVTLERGPDGSYQAVAVRYGGFRGQVDSPFRGKNGAGRDDAPQRPQRNGHPATTSARLGESDPEDLNGDLAGNETVATGSGTEDTDLMDVSTFPALATRSVEAPPIVLEPTAPSPQAPVASPGEVGFSAHATETPGRRSPLSPQSPVTPPPGTVTAPPATASVPRGTVIAPPPPRAPIVEHRQTDAPSTDQLTSDRGTAKPGGLLRWNKSRAHGVVARRDSGRAHGLMAKGAPPHLNLLTGAVTSVSTSPVTTPPQAGTSSVVSSSGPAGPSITAIGRRHPAVGAISP
jgi:Domain of unknown function (DUF5666)